MIGLFEVLMSLQSRNQSMLCTYATLLVVVGFVVAIAGGPGGFFPIMIAIAGASWCGSKFNRALPAGRR